MAIPLHRYLVCRSAISYVLGQCFIFHSNIIYVYDIPNQNKQEKSKRKVNLNYNSNPNATKVLFYAIYSHLGDVSNQHLTSFLNLAKQPRRAYIRLEWAVVKLRIRCEIYTTNIARKSKK